MEQHTRAGKLAMLRVPGIVLHRKPDVYLTALGGRWLLEHCTPSWRVDDARTGFQRIVNVDRARLIARTVLDENRTFPNALTLATTTKEFPVDNSSLTLPATARFLVVDGQHRLWAQKYSEAEGQYPCIIHMDRTEQEMAALFLEINDTQRRVPSSLRWDLVRLVRSGDLPTQMTADLVLALATNVDSPFFAGIDLTGEKKELTIKQGSLAPEIKALISRHSKHKEFPPGTFDEYLALLINFFAAIRSLDSDGWGDPDSTFFKARVLRALLRVLADLVQEKPLAWFTAERLRAAFARIDTNTLSTVELRRVQGATGVRDLYKQMLKQVIRHPRV
jgi:DGQHR domain-containing protein